MRMITSHIIGCLLVISLTLATLVSTRYISDDYDIGRNKRQTADMRASELLAFQEILRRLQSQSCNDFACGLIDIGRRYRKRSWSDQRIAELKAKLGLTYPDIDIAHGRFDPFRIYIKRSSSDQRIAELQAMIGLMQGKGSIAHGKIDPLLVGRRKRDAQLPFKHSQIREILRKLPNLQKEMRQ